jgi:hypothetical protein
LHNPGARLLGYAAGIVACCSRTRIAVDDVTSAMSRRTSKILPFSLTGHRCFWRRDIAAGIPRPASGICRRKTMAWSGNIPQEGLAYPGAPTYSDRLVTDCAIWSWAVTSLPGPAAICRWQVRLSPPGKTRRNCLLPIEGAANAFASAIEHVGIDHRRLDVLVA